MKVTKKKQLTFPFVLTAAEMQRLCGHFDSSRLYIKATGVDEVLREFKTVEEFIGYENAPGKSIRSLGIRVFTERSEQKAYIFFGNYRSNNVLVEISGEENEVLATHEFVEERLHSMRPWYGSASVGNLKGTFIDWLILMALYAPSAS